MQLPRKGVDTVGTDRLPHATAAPGAACVRPGGHVDEVFGASIVQARVMTEVASGKTF
jgi:hypothetical protein